MKKLPIVIAAAAAAATVLSTAVLAGDRTTGRGTGPIIYVESQGLFYDSIVVADLPAEGRFQELIPGGGPEGSLVTDFGPGDVGFLGGRWWVDGNENGMMDEEDAFFLCPLLGPGREEM